MNAESVVAILLESGSLGESSVHLPARGTKWVAVYTGPEPGKQIWRSTGLTDRTAALRLAKQWEAEARMQRLKAPGRPKTLRHRVRSAREDTASVPGLTQREVALILGLSERAVRNIEKRALAKLRSHPEVKALLDEYAVRSAGIKEDQMYTTWEPGFRDWSWTETVALLGLARSAEEREVLRLLLNRLLQ